MVSAYQRMLEPVPHELYVIPLDAEESIAQMLQRLRRERSATLGREVSQREVAEGIGLDEEQQHIISKYESGAIKQPPEERLIALAKFYGVAAQELIQTAYRSRRTKPRALPKNSYAVPGEPALLRHLEVLRDSFEWADIADLTILTQAIAEIPEAERRDRISQMERVARVRDDLKTRRKRTKDETEETA